MHYRHPDLEGFKDNPQGLGPIDPWLAKEKNVVRLEGNRAIFAAGTLLPAELIVVFRHSPSVHAPQQATTP